jgi:phosphatidylglycerol---prolipoprotein diacylglyceryl transferase
MYPQLFEIPLPDWLPWFGGELTIYTYGLLLAAAYLAGLQLALVRARHRGLDANRVMDLGLWIIIAALVGAKLLLVITDFDYFVANPRDIVSIIRSGGVFYGGLILAVIVGLWYMRRHQLPTWTTCDVMAPGIALGHVIGRVGCFLAGCCYGTPTSAPWGVMFTDPFARDNVGTPLGVHLHPTQLYEAGAELLILVALLATERRGRSFAGRTFWLYMLVYGVSRFIIEFFRGDPRGMVAGLSTSQFISVILVPLSIVMLVLLSRRSPAPHPSRRAQAKAA